MNFGAEKKLASIGLMVLRVLCFGGALGLVIVSFIVLVGAFQTKNIGLVGVALGLLGLAVYAYHLGRYGQRHLGKDLQRDEREHEEKRRRYGWRW